MLITRTDLSHDEDIVFTGKFGEVPATYTFRKVDMPTGGQNFGCEVDDPIVIRRLLDIPGYEGHGPLPANMQGSGVDIDSAVKAAARAAYLDVVGEEPATSWTLRDMMEAAYAAYPDSEDDAAPDAEVRSTSRQADTPLDQPLSEQWFDKAGDVRPASPPRADNPNPPMPDEQELKADNFPRLLDASGQPLDIAASTPVPASARDEEVPTPVGVDNSVILDRTELRARYRTIFGKFPGPRVSVEDILAKITEHETAGAAAVREKQESPDVISTKDALEREGADFGPADDDAITADQDEDEQTEEERLASDGGMPKPEDMPDPIPETIAERQKD